MKGKFLKGLWCGIGALFFHFFLVLFTPKIAVADKSSSLPVGLLLTAPFAANTRRSVAKAAEAHLSGAVAPSLFSSPR